MKVAAITTLVASFVLVASTAHADGGMFKDREVIRLFPTFAVMNDDGTSARLPIRVWVFEKEHNDTLRKGVIQAVGSQLEVEKGTPEYAVYTRRMQAFMVDNERGEQVHVTVSAAGRDLYTSTLGPTASNGHFTTVLTIPSVPAGTQQLEVRLSSPNSEAPPVTAQVPLNPANGVTVISDIDDTFKVTGVLDKKELMANTFLREFQAIEGMARLYQTWAAQGAKFHYVSASPWALQEELSDFATKHGFPAAVYHLRMLRLKNVAATVKFMRSSRDHKIASISALFEQLPQRSFLLVGDSGEADPEIYGELARKYPKQVKHIYIREVPGAANTAERFEAAFKGLPATAWTAFADPGQVKLDPVSTP